MQKNYAKQSLQKKSMQKKISDVGSLRINGICLVPVLTEWHFLFCFPRFE